MRRQINRAKRVRRSVEPYEINRHAVRAAVTSKAFLEIESLRTQWPEGQQWTDLFWSMALQQMVREVKGLPDRAAKIMAAKIGAVGALVGLDADKIARLVVLVDVPKFVAAAKSNESIKGFQADPRLKGLWADETIKQNPPVRVEFEHAIVFGTISEAGDIAKSKTWGALIGIEPLRPGDWLYPRNITYSLKETAKQRMRWEFRDVFKEILGKQRGLVNDAVRQNKRDFLRFLNSSGAQVISHKLELTPTQFWRAVRKGEAFGPNGIAKFLQTLEERTKGYSFAFDEPSHGLVNIAPAPSSTSRTT